MSVSLTRPQSDRGPLLTASRPVPDPVHAPHTCADSGPPATWSGISLLKGEEAAETGGKDFGLGVENPRL